MTGNDSREDPYVNIQRWMALFVILILMGCNRPEQMTAVPLGMALQNTLDESIPDSGIKGVSVSVILPDGETWSGASGISHEGIPVTTDMLFDIGSIEKNFQAALTLKLVEEGLLGLDDPIEKWFPLYPNIDGKITVRQLLNMTSGLDKIVDDANSPWRIGYTNITFDKVWSWEELYNAFISKPNFAPGTKCEYSTTNYIVLKHVIENVTQSKQTAEFRNRIMQPYELIHTLVDFSQSTPKNLQIVHGWCDVDGDRAVDDISGDSLDWLVSISPMLVYSTPNDLAKWIDALYHKKAVLREETLEEMLGFRGPVMNETMMRGYGLGVADINLGSLMPRWRDVRVYGHLGSQFGYTTFVGYFPELEITVSMMFNRGCDRGADRAAANVSGAFFDVLLERLGVEKSNELNSVSDLIEELKRTPEDIHLMYRIARMHQANGSDDEALRMYEEILNRDPEDKYGYRIDALFWKASLDGIIREQPDDLNAFIENHTDYHDIQLAYKKLADIYKRRNEIDKAVSVYTAAARKFSEDAYFLNHVAWWIYENEVDAEYADAISYAQEALELLPEECSIWDTLAQLYNVTGQRQKALEASEKALRLAPESQRKEYQEYLDKIRKGK